MGIVRIVFVKVLLVPSTVEACTRDFYVANPSNPLFPFIKTSRMLLYAFYSCPSRSKYEPVSFLYHAS